MPFLFFLIWIVLFLRNPFSGKKYRVHRIKNAIVISRANPEIVIRDYSNYVLNLLLQDSNIGINRKIIFYECKNFKFLRKIISHKSIYLQIEHTLFRPGSVGSLDAPSGNLVCLDNESKYLVRIAEFDKLKQADIIFEYSKINLFNIQSLPLLKDFFEKSFCISPSMYRLNTSPQGREGVITLFGDPNIPRRKSFLDALKLKNITYKNIRGVYSGVEDVYSAAKIVINIRQTDGYDTLEELRVLPALRCGAIVISENAPYAEKTAYSQFVIWGTLQEIPDLVLYVESNYEKVHKSIFGVNGEGIKFVDRMRRIELRNTLAIKKAVNRINFQGYK